MTSDQWKRLRISLTNVTGLGATELVRSLLPALERTAKVADIYLPANGPLAEYSRFPGGPPPHPTKRYLPNAASRLLECTLLSGRFEGSTPLLVLGDLPLRLQARQTVFVHTPHLLLEPAGASLFQQVKFAISRAVFRANASNVDAAIVQTETMRRGLEATYPALVGRVYVVPQPAPEWLLQSGLCRTGRAGSGKLRLFYPAAAYPHKNHALLYDAATGSDWQRLVESLTVTVQPREGDAEHPTICAIGRLDPEAMLCEYARIDALIFPSLAESFGLPLVEAMWVGLPIVCADLPYARALCGEDAIYFSPMDVKSLQTAIVELDRRLAEGWWPDWRGQLMTIPPDWDEVAARMLAIALDANMAKS